MKYQVIIDGNFHYMDPEERSHGPRCATLEEAVQYCKEIVDRCLRSLHRPGMSADELITEHLVFGDDPFVTGGDRGVPFSAQRAREICHGT